MTATELSSFFENHKTKALFGRYISYTAIMPLITQLSKDFEVSQLGESENQVPIHLIKAGQGPKVLLFWSQMHGNESTTTKALFDLLNLLVDKTNHYGQRILNSCTLYIIPMLNPDGANLYTRINFNQIDLNRDAQNLTQSESQVLNQLVAKINPEIAFNLHGQRTIFSAGPSRNSAIMSFLSAAGDQERSITPSRKIAMDIIQTVNTLLQTIIPNQVGRYDDGFNIHCIGDTLAHQGIPAILFEAGHYPGDYDREETRKLVFYSLMQSLYYIATKTMDGSGYQAYFDIPENKKLFYDIIIRNVLIKHKKVDLAIQYEEKLSGQSVKFIPRVAAIADLASCYGHKEFDAKGQELQNRRKSSPIALGDKIVEFSIQDEVFSVEHGKS